MAFPLWPSAVNPNPILPTYFTTWQAPPTTPGATQVANGTEFEQAISDLAATGGTIELTTAGQYLLSETLAMPAVNIKVVALEEGCYIDGYEKVYVWGPDTVATFTGVEFRNNAMGVDDRTVYLTNRASATFRRCKFVPTTHRDKSCVSVNGIGTSCNVESCIFVNASTLWGMVTATQSGVVVIKNSLFICDISAGDHCIEVTTGVITAYNTACRAYGGSDLAFSGTIGGDYNLATDATAPGANSHDNITWANEFDASYLPLTAMGKAGGDPANAAALDYLGNDLSALAIAPIGAIIAV